MVVPEPVFVPVHWIVTEWSPGVSQPLDHTVCF
jgi:hypothetical protein